jgi:hypothetical protein
MAERRRLLCGYYLATPAFWLADQWLGASVRAAALDGLPGWQTAYYLVCIACGAALWLRPAWATLFGLIESSANLLLLALGVLRPQYALLDAVAAEAPATSPLSARCLVNFALSSAIWLLAFYGDLGPSPRSFRRRL